LALPGRLHGAQSGSAGEADGGSDIASVSDVWGCGKACFIPDAANVYVAWTSVLRMALVKAKVLEIGCYPTLPYPI